MANWTIDTWQQLETEGDVFINSNNSGSAGFIDKPTLTVTPNAGYTVKAEDFTIAGVEGVFENGRYKFTNTLSTDASTPINNLALPSGGYALPDEVDFVLIYDSCPTCFTSEDIFQTQNNRVKIEVYFVSSFVMPPNPYTANIDVDGTAKAFVSPTPQSYINSFILTSAYRPDLKPKKWLQNYNQTYTIDDQGGTYVDFLTTKEVFVSDGNSLNQAALNVDQWYRLDWMIPYEDDNTSNIYFQAKFHEGIRQRWLTYEAQKKQDPGFS